MESGTSQSKEAQKKKLHWSTSLGRQEIEVQRYLDGKKLVIPFCHSAEMGCRDYSLLLERVVTDFGADVSFGQVVEKLQEHYGLNIPASAVQNITKKHAKVCYDLLEEKEGSSIKADCLIGEMDGAMIPILSFEPNESADRRKWRKTKWKEARLSVVRKHNSTSKIFLATLGSTDRAGTLLGCCAKRLGWNNKSKVHCLGDGARWIYEQVDRVFGAQGEYLIDFFHLIEYLANASKSCCKDNPKEWLKKQQTRMKEGGCNVVLAELKTYLEPKEESDENAPVRRCLRYMKNRKGQFDYQSAIEKKLPIGSGEVESGNRSVVQKRLKIAGAWWKVETAEHILALRCVRINGDWKEYWERYSPNWVEAA